MSGRKRMYASVSQSRYSVATIETRGHDEPYAVVRRFGPLSSRQEAVRKGRERCGDHHYEASGCDVTEEAAEAGVDLYDDDALEDWFVKNYETQVKHFVTYPYRP